MARPIRIEYKGAQYHVISRANERKRIFTTKSDYELFLKTLAEACERFDLELLAYVVMPNHYHLYAETPQGNLSRAIGWLQTTFTIRYNLKKKRNGHLFQGRYKAQLVEDDAYGQELISYIHLNPIRSRRKGQILQTGTWEQLMNYRWSSHLSYFKAETQSSVPLNLKYLKFWGGDVKTSRSEYRRSLKRLVTGEELLDPLSQIKEGLVLGGESFLNKAKKRVAKKTGSEEQSFRKRWQNKDQEKRIRALVKGQKDQRVVIWALIRLGGASGVKLAAEFGYQDGSGVARVVERVDKIAEKKPEMKTLLESIRKASRFKS